MAYDSRKDRTRIHYFCKLSNILAWGPVCRHRVAKDDEGMCYMCLNKVKETVIKKKKERMSILTIPLGGHILHAAINKRWSVVSFYYTWDVDKGYKNVKKYDYIMFKKHKMKSPIYTYEVASKLLSRDYFQNRGVLSIYTMINYMYVVKILERKGVPIETGYWIYKEMFHDLMQLFPEDYEIDITVFWNIYSNHIDVVEQFIKEKSEKKEGEPDNPTLLLIQSMIDDVLLRWCKRKKYSNMYRLLDIKLRYF